MIIPHANISNLMLDERVLQAVRNGQFHVYAVRYVDEALSLLVGQPAGAPDEKGNFPTGSVNARVVERLKEISEMGMDEDEKEKPVKEVASKAAKSEKAPVEKERARKKKDAD
ncbi:hypothetical protein D9M71_386280 [compost metagenome]